MTMDLSTIPRAPITRSGSSFTQAHGADVHKTRRAAVLARAWRAAGRDRFVVRSQWPAVHSHYGMTTGGVPPLALVAETLRQAVILISHRGYGVPHESAFVMCSLEVALLGQLDPADEGAEVSLSLQCGRIRRHGAALRGMETTVLFRTRNTTIGVGHSVLKLLPANVYTRIRKDRLSVEHRSPGSRLGPGAVRAKDASDVLLARGRDGSLVVALDTAHPFHFDHPADHVPGMVLIEAALQAHSLETGPAAPVELSADFSRYAELLPAITLDTQVRGGHTMSSFHQDGTEVAAVQVRGRA